MSEDESPAVAFERYLAEARATLPERYRHPGQGAAPRSFTPWRSPPFVFAVVLIALVGLALARWLGYAGGP